MQTELAVAEFKERDPTLEKFFNDSVGYVVFPGIVKAGFIIGGAHGKGLVFKNGEYVGDASVTQGTVGLQVGGASYREIIFFQEEWRLKQFMSGNFAFSASASAVAVTAGAAKNVRYNRGVAVFTLARGGLMLEASIGGQKFAYRSASSNEDRVKALEAELERARAAAKAAEDKAREQVENKAVVKTRAIEPLVEEMERIKAMKEPGEVDPKPPVTADNE